MIITVPCYVSCVGNDGRASGSGARLDSMRTLWRELNLRAEYDSLIGATVPFMEESRSNGDSLSFLYACTYLAQSYMYKENLDSLRRYLDMVSAYGTMMQDYRLEAMVDNLWGIYSLKSGLDYSSALVHFKQMYESSLQAEDEIAQLVALTNIVNIFYIKSDGYGLDYAMKAARLASTIETRDDAALSFYKALAELSMSQMLYLNGDTEGAAACLETMDSLSVRSGSTSLTAMSDLLHADICVRRGLVAEARMHYCDALSRDGVEPGIISLVYLNYGRFCEENGDVREAVQLYREGMNVSYLHGNMMFRSELLRRLSRLYCSLGDSSKAFYCLRHFSDHLDSISVRDTEKEFNALLLSYQDMEHRNEMQAKELALFKARRKMSIALMVIALVIMLSVSLMVIYYRQRKMYKVLVSQHQSFIQRFNMGMASPGHDETSSPRTAEHPVRDTGDRELFAKVERLMREEEVFRMKDLTLDKLAEKLQTNRTYLSKAINTYAGMSFSSYVNMYRINEATRIISDPARDVLFKKLADDIGFNSVPVFSSVFQKETGLLPSNYRKEVLSGKKKVQNS